MSRFLPWYILSIALVGQPVAGQDLTAGTWTGKLVLDVGAEVEVEMTVTAGTPPTATMNAVGRPPSPVENLREEGEALLFDWGGFSCVVSKDGSTLEGQCGTTDGTRGRLTLEAPGDVPEMAEDVITLEDMREAKASTVYEAVQLLRPRWLRARGRQRFTREAQVVVYFDSQRMGGVSLLEGLDPEVVLEVRYYNAPDATMKFGTNNDGGVIQVVRRRE